MNRDEMAYAMLAPIRTATLVAIEHGWITGLEDEQLIAAPVSYISLCWRR